jgi:pyrroloquinoline-quinone synthase
MSVQLQRRQQLDSIVAQYDLNKHPFYVEWVNGTLPKEKLTDYSYQYASFVDTIDEGWDTLGEKHLGAEEREHEQLWAAFQHFVGGASGSLHPATLSLTTVARNSFGEKAEAIGALFAFEAQQPNTSRSKLDGLEKHYSPTAAGKEYFRVHADDWSEVDILLKHADALSDAEFEKAKSACTLLCSAMWHTLDRIYYA